MLTRFLSHLRQQSLGALALFIVLGGTSYAVATGSIDSREIKNNTIASKDIRNNQVSTSDVRNGSLLSQDFKAGQLPAGPRGPQGPQGPQGLAGAQGPAGPVEAELFSGHHAARGNHERQFFAVPGLGTVDYHALGSNAGGCSVSFTNTSGQDVYVTGVRTSSAAGPTSVADVVANGSRFTLQSVTTGPASAFSHLQAIRADAAKVLELTSSSRFRLQQPDCVGAAQGTLND